MAIGEDVELEDLGGWRLHAEQTGLIDYFVDDDDEAALKTIRKFLSYMPSHNGELPPDQTGETAEVADQAKILNVLPEKRTQVYNMKKIIEIVVDQGSYFEIKERFGKSATVGLARLDGKVVGIVANNPIVGGGNPECRSLPKNHRLFRHV